MTDTPEHLKAIEARMSAAFASLNYEQRLALELAQKLAVQNHFAMQSDDPKKASRESWLMILQDQHFSEMSAGVFNPLSIKPAPKSAAKKVGA